MGHPFASDNLAKPCEFGYDQQRISLAEKYPAFEDSCAELNAPKKNQLVWQLPANYFGKMARFEYATVYFNPHLHGLPQTQILIKMCAK